MIKPLLTSVTIDEAVARLINLGEIRPGLSTMDMTQFLLLAAEDEFDNAKKEGLPTDLLETRVQASKARDLLAANLFRHLTWETETPPEDSLLVIDPNSSKLEIESVANWALYHYNIIRFDYEELNYNAHIEKPSTNIEKEVKKITTEGLTPKLAVNLYVTFALLLQAFADATGPKYGTSDKINVKSIAEALTSAEPMEGQKFDAIKKRIELARAIIKVNPFTNK